MTPNITTPKQALNPAFLKLPPNREEIELFKKEFITLFDRIDAKESEEFHKNLIKDFLNAVYYKDKHYINTKDRTDLVIHNDNNTTSSVGVLIETKSPTNKTEMVRCGSGEHAGSPLPQLNVKSFQELVLYYLRERKTGKNFELRYLIVTNIHEWFVFDAQDFEKLFYQNKTLLNRFEQFQAGKLSGTTTDFFYKEIAAPEIQKLQNEIPFTYFNIRDYEKIIRNGNKEDDRQLIALYKFLSPVHLLKRQFANDNNQLNKEFYAELLHIIGLEEITQEGRKLIVRKKENERNNGSIIENAIERIVAKNKLDNVAVEAQCVASLQQRQFDIALDLAITWINRILFLKLLESQIIKYNNSPSPTLPKGEGDFPSSAAFLSSEKLNSYHDLDTLFFSVLARKEEERTESIKRKFAHVPYLNSSLFEMTEMENKTICIDSLQDNIEMELYSKSVLTISGSIRPLEYLLRFLDAYDFSSEGAEEIQEENKPLISASVLGLIFEKINGYKDGSFFTPSFITMYMCRETIGRAVVQKFKSLSPDPSPKERGVSPSFGGGWGEAHTINDLHNLIPQIGIERANEIFNQIRICDPAVGSGHFLVSALNEMIYLKSELGILTDKNGKSLWNYTVTVDNDELIIRNPDGDIFVYNPKSPESQRIQEAFFHEKQTIIENCLFGVDINPNSVKICQLRLWIELLKHAYYITPLSPNLSNEGKLAKGWEQFSPFGGVRGDLQTLPNIDINIKCGNSLMSRFALDDKYMDNPALQQKLKQATKRYKEYVFLYKQCDDKAAKRQFTKNIETEKAFFYQLNNANDADYKNLQKAQNELSLHTQSFNFFETETDEWNNKTTELTEKLNQAETLYHEKIHGCFEWRFEFPEVLDDDGNFAGFDVVMGNPPYIDAKKLREIGSKLQHYDVYSGTADLSVYFFEKGINLLKNNGLLMLITTNKFFNTGYGKLVRKKIIENQIWNIVDFEQVEIFDSALVSSVVIGIENNAPSKDEFVYKKFFKLKNNEIKAQFIGKKNDFGTYKQSLLNENEWSFSDDAKLELKNKIENAGTKLSELEGVAIYRGVTTGYNPAFIIDENKKNELIAADPNNEQIIKPLLQGRNIRKWVYNKSDEFLLFIPWHFPLHLDDTISGSSSIAENKLIRDYPILYNHLNQHKSNLLNRNKEETGIRYEWYVLQRCAASYYPEFEKSEKIIWGLTADKWAYAYDDGQHYLPSNGYILTSEKISIKYLLGLLNSNLLKFYFGFIGVMTAGGAFTLKHATIQQLPIAIADNQQPIIDLVNQILAAKKENAAADTGELEREIDEVVYKLYGLTGEEVKIIEK